MVPYKSAHLDDAESEVIVPADHTRVHHHPRAVLELRRILLEHYQDYERRSALLQYADKLGEPIRVGAQRFGFAIIDDPSFVQDHSTGRERQCDAAVLLNEDD